MSADRKPTMRIKHISFRGIDAAKREAWLESQRIWLERSVASGGLVCAYGAEGGGHARAVFAWTDEPALHGFMERSHDAAMAAAGTVGRSSVLYLDPLYVLRVQSGGEPTQALPIPTAGVGFVGETVAWVREEGDAIWMKSQGAWNQALERAEGCLGGFVARGRRTFVVTSFWRDEASHARYEREIVPTLRERAAGDEHTVRLLRFSAATIPSLRHPAASEAP
jgi:heme-degrading monooxygenase HmoA